MKNFRIICLRSIPLLFLFLSAFALKQNSQEMDEYNLKAAFIYNFTKYINWNVSAADEKFVIGVLGECPVKEALDAIARTKTVNGRAILILQFNKPQDIRFCNVLFIPKNNTFSLSEILTKASKGTLTISEKEGYAIRGIAINFITIDNKLKFEANTKAINSAGLTASSQLLKLALIVE